MVQGDPRRAKMARREAGTDRLARLSPAESLQNQSICNPLCTGNADIFFCPPRREVWGLQTLARFRISGGGGGHFSGEFLDEFVKITLSKYLCAKMVAFSSFENIEIFCMET